MYITIGKLRRAHGLNGELVMDVLTDFPERLKKGKTVYVGPDYLPYLIENIREHDKALIIAFSGLTDSDQASLLRNLFIYVESDTLPSLPEGEYYHHQLIGMTVVNEAEEELGTLTEILETGANDVYLIITPDGKELLLPAIEDVVINVNLDQKRMHVRPQEWL